MPHYDTDAIVQQWNNLINGDTVDASRIRPAILQSWKHCREKGVDAHCVLRSNGNVTLLLERSAELIAAAKPFMEMINEVIAGSGLRIDCIDHEGYFLCSCGDPTLVKESESNGFVTGCHVGLDTLGTNAAGLCLSLEKPVQVLGPEHYNVNLHNLNCSATPIHAPNSELVGVLNGQRLTLYLDHAADNRPVTDGELTLELPGFPGQLMSQLSQYPFQYWSRW